MFGIQPTFVHIRIFVSSSILCLPGWNPFTLHGCSCESRIANLARPLPVLRAVICVPLPPSAWSIMICQEGVEGPCESHRIGLAVGCLGKPSAPNAQGLNAPKSFWPWPRRPQFEQRFFVQVDRGAPPRCHFRHRRDNRMRSFLTLPPRPVRRWNRCRVAVSEWPPALRVSAARLERGSVSLGHVQGLLVL